MVRAVRNFWISAKIDGRESEVEGGPRGIDGGFRERIYVRDEGSITQAFYIEGRYIYSTGGLEIVVRNTQTGEELRLQTKR